jgi:hypothetical protein
MSVVFQAKSAAPSAFEGVTSFNKTNMTVAAGSNRVMLIFLNFVSGIDYPGTVSMAWNVQGATLIDSYNTSAGGQFTSVQLWGVINPAVGNLTLAANWATTADVVVECISVTGALQTGGTATFSGAVHNEDVSGVDTLSQAVASNVGDLVVGHFSNPRRAFTSTNQTNIFLTSVGGGAQNAAANRAAGASPTVTMTATAVGAVSSFVAQGVNIVQGAPPPTQALTPALYVDTDTFRTPDVPRVLTPGLYADTDTFTTQVVSGFLSDNLFQSKVTDTDTFRTPVVTTGGVVIAPALYRDEDVLGTHEVAIVPVSVAGVTQMLARSGPRRQR